MRSDRLGETLLPKKLALPVFASDALSSVAYAPDEIFLTLGLAGGALALTASWQIALAVVVVMLVVVASYRQNVHAYPSGGGDYEVATTNLGPGPVSPWPARCSSTTSSPWRSRSRRVCRTPQRPCRSCAATRCWSPSRSWPS